MSYNVLINNPTFQIPPPLPYTPNSSTFLPRGDPLYLTHSQPIYSLCSVQLII